MSAKPVIAILGGTGDLGSGLAKRWIAAGYSIVIGSRSADKARSFAKELGAGARGDDHVGAAKSADIIVLAVPFASHEATLLEVKNAVQGKIVVDAAVPLVPPKVSVVQLPPKARRRRLPRTCSARASAWFRPFIMSAPANSTPGGRVDCDVLVFGNDKESRDIVIGLAGEVGNCGIDGGVLANSAAEALTSVLIGINRRYKVPGAGIRITGLPTFPSP
jgi:NADPH-dependent F420 reductase